MTTPEPSPLSEQELKTLEEYTQSLVCCVCDGPDADGDHDDDCQAPFWQLVSRAIAQARAARPSPREQQPGDSHMTKLHREIASALNRYSCENDSNTPDFILAEFLLKCLRAWDESVRQRERWYGRDPNCGPVGTISQLGPDRSEPPHPVDRPAPPAQDGGRP